MSTPSFRRILELLERHGVEYVVGGGRRYEDVADAATTLLVGALPVRVLPRKMLIEDKRALGRDKDLAVLRLLEDVLTRSRGQ